MYSRDAIAFEANKIGLAETIYVDMASVDLDVLEICSVLFLTGKTPRFGVESIRAPR